MGLHLLIAEDAPDIAEVVAFSARMIWPDCHVTIAANGTDAIAHFKAAPAELVILDVSMPPPDGFEVCRRIRAMSGVPILMLTVRDATLDKVRALDLGADDYLTKPFDPLELFARLRSLLRRADAARVVPHATFTVDSLTLNFATQQVYLGSEQILLTSTEYRLLEELVRHAGKVMSHQYLLERVWGPEYTGDTHYLKVVVRRLRQKLDDDAGTPRYIQTIWGSGYRFTAPSYQTVPTTFQ